MNLSKGVARDQSGSACVSGAGFGVSPKRTWPPSALVIELAAANESSRSRGLETRALPGKGALARLLLTP